MMVNRWFKWGIVVWVWISLAGVSGIPIRTASSEEMPLLRIGTAGLKGVYYPIGQAYPYFLPGVIPAGTYPGIPEIPTLEVYALLLVREDVDENLVYELTKTLWSAETQGLLQAAHPLGHAITMPSALHGLTVALHPGAVQFYRQHNALPKGDAIP